MLKYDGRNKNEKRIKEQKSEIIGKHLNEHTSVRTLESVTNKVGSSLPYYHCLEYLIEKKERVDLCRQKQPLMYTAI